MSSYSKFLSVFLVIGGFLLAAAPRTWAQDCNNNGIPDECDIDCGDPNDPNNSCDVPGCGQSEDCQPNGIPDECDIGDGTSQDCNGNGIPDECEPESVLYVDGDAPGGGDGTSWATAFNDLQDALDVANPGDTIHVAEGVYLPDRGTADRVATFQLVNCVAIKGGYAGLGEPDPDERDIVQHETTLTGDIGTPGSNADNAYHVVTGSGTDETAILDGFTITAGNANGLPYPHSHGGGMCSQPNELGSNAPTVLRCTFVGNSAAVRGGGVYNAGNASGDHSTPTFIDCTFSENAASDGGGMYDWRSSPMLINCIFSNNWASNEGGGMCNYHISNATLTNCTFVGNSAGSGGAMHNYYSDPEATNCVFTGNWAADIGGALYQYGCDLAWVRTLTNCTFSGNSAGNHGGGRIIPGGAGSR